MAASATLLRSGIARAVTASSSPARFPANPKVSASSLQQYRMKKRAKNSHTYAHTPWHQQHLTTHQHRARSAGLRPARRCAGAGDATSRRPIGVLGFKLLLRPLLVTRPAAGPMRAPASSGVGSLCRGETGRGAARPGAPARQCKTGRWTGRRRRRRTAAGGTGGVPPPEMVMADSHVVISGPTDGLSDGAGAAG